MAENRKVHFPAASSSPKQRALSLRITEETIAWFVVSYENIEEDGEITRQAEKLEEFRRDPESINEMQWYDLLRSLLYVYPNWWHAFP